jgi:hypothetical protein
LEKPSVSRKQLVKEKTIKQVEKRESIDEKNVVEGKKVRKPTQKFDL